ncbi:MAG: prepilin-type N-terminal cleavage/methylation domain-containing protein [Akkermansia sp.]|nr:prepilin-type N-terminal cleavage/methylation domain-containing protein [Akkermansia sp.]
MKTCKRHGAGAFTLVEILICIAILALLSVILLEVRGYINNKKLQNTAQNQIALLETGLNNYRSDNAGNLPDGDGDEFSSHTLFASLYRDANNDGIPDKESDVQLPPYTDAFAVIQDTKARSELDGIPVIKQQVRTTKGRKKLWVIQDPWGNLYRYRLGFDQENSKGKPGKGFNPDFDIFSLGGDGLGDNTSNEGENADNVSNVRSWK